MVKSMWILVRSGGVALLLALSLIAMSPTAQAAEPSVLSAGQTLSAGQRLLSPDGRYQAVMQHDGNFVVYGPSGAVWSSGSGGTGDGATAVMQGDGNFVVYRAGYTAMFSTSTAFGRDSRLVLQSDGNLVVYSSGGVALWSSYGGRTPSAEDSLGTGQTLYAGQSLRSANGSYRAVLQHDGNLVVYGPGSTATWSTGTGGVGDGVTAVMQGDGNFVLYAPGTRAIYSSSTAPSGGAFLRVQDDGNLVVYDRTGRALWAKGQPVTNLPNPYGCSSSDNGCVAFTGFNPSVSYWGQATNSRGNCTNYAAYRIQQRGTARLAGTGNAITWRQRAINQFGARAVNGTPTVGSIAWWGSSYSSSGHVGYVERVESNGVVWTSESIYGVGSRRRVLSPGTGNYPQAFLHLAPGT